MQLRMWTYDCAREQSPTLDYLRRLCQLSLESGYNGLGLYLEHRFAYPSAPWSHGRGAITPEMIEAIQSEFKDLQIIPFVNLLGHSEGMLYTEYGKRYAEEVLRGMQACPSNEAFVEFAKQTVDDVVGIFTSPIIHIGGDETRQLGECPACHARVSKFQETEGVDGKAELYGLHFGPLCRHLVEKGRTPAVWGDMFLDHPQALQHIPTETIIFDWQYFGSPRESSRALGGRNPIVLSPSLQTYNAAWFHLAQSEINVLDHCRAFLDSDADSPKVDVLGICLTTWEGGLMGNYNTLFPALKAAGRMVASPAETLRLADSLPRPNLSIDGEEDGFDEPVRQAAAALLSKAMDEGAHRVVLDPKERGMKVDFYTHHGTYIAFNYPSALRQPMMMLLKDFAGMDRSAKGGESIGGRYGGERFDWTLAEDPTLNGPRLTLTRNPDSFSLPDFANRATQFLAAYDMEVPGYREWAMLMGVELQKCGGVFAWKGQRSSLKSRLLLQANPFLAWLHHGQELSGPRGDLALEVVEQALAVAPDSDARGVSQFVKGAIEFCRFAEQARQAYAQGLPGVAISCLSPARQIFDDLAKVARATQINACGSLADVERCRIAKRHVEVVILRIKEYGDGSLGYLPAFEIITHPRFVPHDQASWWLINAWCAE